MKLFKILISFSPIFILFSYIFFFTQQINLQNPNSIYNQKVTLLNEVINLAEIKFKIQEVSSKRNEAQLVYNKTVAFISLNLDTYSQVATLQNIIKTANIKGKNVELIDLTSQNPYATLKDR